MQLQFALERRKRQIGKAGHRDDIKDTATILGGPCVLHGYGPETQKFAS
jgi:hypothetical protein